MGTSPLVQGYDRWSTVQFTGFKSAECIASKTHHGTRDENTHSVMYFLSRLLLLKKGSKSPSENLPLIVSGSVGKIFGKEQQYNSGNCFFTSFSLLRLWHKSCFGVLCFHEVHNYGKEQGYISGKWIFTSFLLFRPQPKSYFGLLCFLKWKIWQITVT